MTKPKKKAYRSITGAALIAACLTLAAVSFFPAENSALYYEGRPIGKEPVAVCGEEQAKTGIRTAALFPTVIELEISRDTEVSVSHGDAEFSSEGCLHWTLPAEITEATLTVTQNNKTTQYSLHASADGVWYMEKK